MTSEIEEKTAKCIRCGFCLDACPTFRLTGQETLSPRGRIYLVRSWHEGAIELDSGAMDALDSCLGCRACETACPSGVEYGAILEMAREEIEDSGLRPGSQRFARKEFVNLLTNPALLKAALKAGGIMGKVTGGKMPGFAAKMLTGRADARVKLPALSEGSAATKPLPERSPAKGVKRHTVAVLEGCVMRVLFGGVNRATVRVLQENGCETVSPREAGCCGALHLHIGLREEAQDRAKALIAAFEPYLDEIDAIVLNSAGCGSAMKEYGELLAHEPGWAERAAAFAAKVKDVSEWLMDIGPVAPGRAEQTVSYHDACHLAHAQKIKQPPRQLLQLIPGLKLVEMEEADTCCGSAGVYNILQPEMARELLLRKVANLKATGASVVATGNPGCLAWIRQGAQEEGLDVRICHPVELLDEAYRTAPEN